MFPALDSRFTDGGKKAVRHLHVSLDCNCILCFCAASCMNAVHTYTWHEYMTLFWVYAQMREENLSSHAAFAMTSWGNHASPFMYEGTLLDKRAEIRLWIMNINLEYQDICSALFVFCILKHVFYLLLAGTTWLWVPHFTLTVWKITEGLCISLWTKMDCFQRSPPWC